MTLFLCFSSVALYGFLNAWIESYSAMDNFYRNEFRKSRSTDL